MHLCLTEAALGCWPQELSELCSAPREGGQSVEENEAALREESQSHAAFKL